MGCHLVVLVLSLFSTEYTVDDEVTIVNLITEVSTFLFSNGGKGLGKIGLVTIEQTSFL